MSSLPQEEVQFISDRLKRDEPPAAKERYIVEYFGEERGQNIICLLPHTMFNGKRVPARAFATPSGGVTSEILVDCMKHMDALDLFPREEGVPDPFLLRDGHQSRLQLPFLSYIMDQGHPWSACQGTPNGSSDWQFHDSSRENGNFKIQSSNAKDRLLAIKEKWGLPQQVEQTDIVPILHETMAKDRGAIMVINALGLEW